MTFEMKLMKHVNMNTFITIVLLIYYMCGSYSRIAGVQNNGPDF